MITSFRWLMVIPAGVAAWYFALLIGLRLLGLVQSLCPPEKMISGFCQASWYPAAERATICFGAATSALLVVVAATLVAPSHRIAMSRVALGAGTCVATLLAVQTDTYLALVSAVTAGAIAVLGISYFSHRIRGTSHVP